MKILFLGNSHTYYNDLPILFREICLQMGKKVEVGMLAQPGVTYEWHLTQYTDLRFALMYGGYDHMIIQQAAHEPCPQKEETLRDAKKLITMAKEQGINVIQTLPWARLGIPEEQEKMDGIYSAVAKENSIKLNPVGRVFEYIRLNYPDIRLHWFDGAHAGPYGSYANALCTYALLFGCIDIEKVDNISFDMYPTESCGAVTDRSKMSVSLDPEKADMIKNAVKVVLRNQIPIY